MAPFQFERVFDARTVDPAAVMPLIPNGDYYAQIVDSEVKTTKDGQGGYLELTEEIIHGQFQGRRLQNRLNLFNQSQTAVEIAYRTLSAICHVTGVFAIQNSQELHGKPHMIIVGTSKDGQYNEIKGYKDVNGQQPGRRAANGQASLPMTAPAAPVPPAAAPAAFAAAQQPAWQPPSGAPAWGPPGVQPTAPAPTPAAAWQPPATAAPAAPAAPAWQPPSAPVAQAAAPAQPAWQPPSGAPAPQAAPNGKPPWAQ